MGVMNLFADMTYEGASIKSAASLQACRTAHAALVIFAFAVQLASIPVFVLGSRASRGVQTR